MDQQSNEAGVPASVRGRNLVIVTPDAASLNGRNRSTTPISNLDAMMEDSPGSSSSIDRTTPNISAATSPTPRSRIMSKVLKRLKGHKWRKRRSRTASEALSDSASALQCSTFSFSESGSVTSNSIWNEEDDEQKQHTLDEATKAHEQPREHSKKLLTKDSPEREGETTSETITYEKLGSSVSDATATATTTTSTTTSCLTNTAARSTVALQGDLDHWFMTAHALLSSNEMKAFLTSSNKVVTSAIKTSAGTALTASGMVVKTAFLPVTLPLNVAASTTDLVINVAGGAIHHVFQHDKDTDRNESNNPNEKTYHTPAQDLLHHVFNFIPFVVHNTVKMVTPALAMEQPRRVVQEDTCKYEVKGQVLQSSVGPDKTDSVDVVLQRLRLDIYPGVNEEFKMEVIRDVEDDTDDDATTRTDTTDSSAALPANPSGATKADFSKFLLRVDDVTVLAPPDPASDKALRMFYVDLDSEFGDDQITKDALEQLIQRGVDVASSNPAVAFSCTPMHQGGKSNTAEIEWKPEGKTKRDVKALSLLQPNEYFDALRCKVLIWSGKYCGPKYHGSDNALFMARGIVNGSPLAFTSMLWDSTRTRQYNNYCLGRKDVVIINDDFSNGGSYGAKVIKSETKVPFTNLSVFLSAVMHVRALGDRPEDGFMIFSRSLDTGRAGCHVGRKHNNDQSNKNEIILGVNIMRPVPGHPDMTDLLSVSQVNASMVPPFLAFRIGMMGVEDFFKNVRS